jgi:acyl carrier protein
VTSPARTGDAAELVRRAVLSMLPELPESALVPEADLAALGANSLDRVDIALMLEEDAGVTLPAERLAAAQTIGELTDLVREYERRA